MKDIKWKDTNWDHAQDGNEANRKKFPTCAECGAMLIKGTETMGVNNPYTKELIGFLCGESCFEVYKLKYMRRFGLD